MSGGRRREAKRGGREEERAGWKREQDGAYAPWECGEREMVLAPPPPPYDPTQNRIRSYDIFATWVDSITLQNYILGNSFLFLLKKNNTMN